jgi:deoxyribodipyrimidine photolyase
LGKDYPMPIVSHEKARAEALAALATIRKEKE